MTSLKHPCLISLTILILNFTHISIIIINLKSSLYQNINYLSKLVYLFFPNVCITTHLDDICCISFSNNECSSSLLLPSSYSSTKSHLFCTYFLWVLIKYLPELQFISNFIHIFIDISSRSSDPSFSEITHA